MVFSGRGYTAYDRRQSKPTGCLKRGLLTSAFSGKVLKGAHPVSWHIDSSKGLFEGEAYDLGIAYIGVLGLFTPVMN
jgi:hypothetical protein